MKSYNEKCVILFTAMIGVMNGRVQAMARDDRGEVSSYLVFVALLVAAVAVLAGLFGTLFQGLMTNICTAAGTTC